MEGGGLTILKLQGHGGIMHFGNSKDQVRWAGGGGMKYGSCPWYGMHIFWNCPI